MKNTFFLFISLTCFFVLGACSKDLGNYDYEDINSLIIVDKDGVDISGKQYDMLLGDSILIEPKVSGTLSGMAGLELQFYWILDQDTISQKRNFSFTSSQLGLGRHTCKLVVVDRQTSLAYNIDFTILISSGITKGSFILTENESHKTTLVMRGLNKGGSYLYFKNFNNLKLGDYPIALYLSYNLSRADNIYSRLMAITQEGDYPMLGISLNTLFPSFMYGKDISSQQLSPTYLWLRSRGLSTDVFEGIVLMDGKCRALIDGIISDDVYRTDPLDYDFGKNGVIMSSASPGNILAGFDQKNERIRMFGNGFKSSWTFDRNFDYQFDATATKGHQFVAADDNFDGRLWRWQFLTRKGSEIFMHHIDMDLSGGGIKPNKPVIVASETVPEMVDAVNFIFSGEYWYFAQGRSIYRCSKNGLDIEIYLSLPNDGSGSIVAWNFDVNPLSQFKKIGIATYDPVAVSFYKGSYYLYDIASGQFDQQHLHIIDKAVDVKIGL